MTTSERQDAMARKLWATRFNADWATLNPMVKDDWRKTADAAIAEQNAAIERVRALKREHAGHCCTHTYLTWGCDCEAKAHNAAIDAAISALERGT